MDHLYKEATKEVLAPFKKVPGEIKPIGRLSHEAKAFRESILKKSVPELKDLLNRQNAILRNAQLVAKLPDKGAKVKDKKAQIEQLLEERTKLEDQTADMIKGLKLVDTEAMEWKHGGAMFKGLDQKVKIETSESEDVLRLLASKEVPDKKTTNIDYSEGLTEKIDAR